MSKLMRIIRKNEPQLQKSYLRHALQKQKTTEYVEFAKPELIPAEMET